ncbi:MAG: hypothetical protein IJD28_01435 [Deferribacterales bacterium]|nr:hypothetical protein [Deferribacterales bacterium]
MEGELTVWLIMIAIAIGVVVFTKNPKIAVGLIFLWISALLHRILG